MKPKTCRIFTAYAAGGAITEALNLMPTHLVWAVIVYILGMGLLVYALQGRSPHA